MNFLRYFLFGIVAFNASISGVHANDGVNLRLSYLKDPTHLLQVEEISEKQFTPISDNFALGFTHDTVWLKIEAKISLDSGQHFLYVRPPRLEDIKLFALNHVNNAFIEVAWTSENQNINNIFYDAFKRNFFDLSLHRDKNTFFLKINTDNSLNGGVELINREKIESHRINQGFLLGGVVFGLIPFVFIFLALAIYKKVPVYRVYFFSLLSTTFLYLAIYGFDWARLLFQSNITLDHQIGILGIVNICFSYAFLCYVCEILGAPRQFVNKGKVFLLICLVVSPVYFWLDKQFVLQIFYYCILALTFIIIFFIVRYFNKKNILQWLIAILFITISIGAAKVFLSLLGIVSTSDNVLASQTFRIVTIPFALLVLVGYYELENNKYITGLIVEKTLNEQHKKYELERRKIYESFITMLVHEIKTPLAVIQIAASSLSRHLANNSAETNRINNIKKSVVEINQIFNKCVQVVDIENGSIALEPSEFSIDFLSEDIQRAIDNNRLKCIYPAKSKLNTDFVLLKTILINLISNALKYGHEDKQVELKIVEIFHQAKPFLQFSVTNAIGAVGTPDTQKLFTRYYRSESAKKFTGSGLGLWLSQELTKILGGVITVDFDNSNVRFSFRIEGKVNG